MKLRKSWLWILATLMIVVLCTAGCALADGATDPHLKQVLQDEQLFRKLGAKGNRDSSIQWDENVLKLTETQAPSLGGSGVYTITWNPPVNTTVVSMRAYLWMRDYSDDLTTVYLLEKENSVDPSFTTAEIVSEGSYSVVVYVTIADDSNNETTYVDYLEFEIGDGSSATQLNRKIAQIVEDCTVSGNAWQTALNLHDWLTNHAYYDLSYQYYGADGVLLRGYGVCDSYSKAYLMLCKAAGVTVSRVTGWAGDAEDGESHAWNAIQLNGEWYYVDVTWDDSGSAAMPGTGIPGSGLEDHVYFCLNEDLMSLDHTNDKECFNGSCTSLAANWTLRNTSEAWSSWEDWNDLGNNYFSDGLQQYSGQIREQLEAGAADSFTVPCEDLFTVITEEQDGIYRYYGCEASSAPAVRGWTLLGMALSRVDFDGRTAAVNYDRTSNCFVVEPDSAVLECAHDHLYDSEPVQVTETGEFYVWEDMAQHRVYGKQTAHFYICPDCGFMERYWDCEAEYDDDQGLEDHIYEDGQSFCSRCGTSCWHYRIHEPGVELQTREKSAEREWITWPDDEDYHVLAYVKSTYKVCPDCQTEVVLSRQIADDEDLEALEALKEEHDFSSGECKCGRWCPHSFENGVCEICGFECSHEFGEHSNGVCDICGYVCTHEDHLIPVTSEPIIEYEWISAEQHAVLTTVTSYAYCEVCGYSTDPVTEMTTEPEDHTDEDSDGTCDICGQRLTGEWLWEYSSYGVDTTRGTLLITGSGTIPDYEAGGAPWAGYAGTIERIIIDPGIRGIGVNAFAGLNYTVRVDFKGHTCPEISGQAFAGTTAICRHYTVDNSWPEDGGIQNGDGHTITWFTLPFFDPEAEESSITLWYSDSNGWYTQNDGLTYRMTAAQANELAFRYRRLELEDLPSATDFSLMTENWDGIYSIGFTAGCSGSWTVTVPYNGDSQMWVTNAAHNLILNLNTAKNSQVSLRVEDGTTVVNGDLDRLTMFVPSSDYIGSAEINGDVNAMYLEEDTENSKFWGYLKVNGTVYTGRITGEASVPVTKDGKTLINFGHIVIAETPEICQEEPIIENGNLNVAVAANSDWSRFYDMDYYYDYAADTCDVCLMPKPGGPDGTYIEEISPFSIDDVIYGDTNLAIVNYTGDEPLVIPGDTDGAGNKTGLKQLVVENARVKVSCPVDMLNTPGFGNAWYDITIDDQVGDLWFGGENPDSRVYITGSGSVQASFLSRIFRSKLLCFRVGGVGDFYSNRQLHVPYFKEGQTITYILPGDDALAAAAGLESGSAMMDLDQLSEYDLSAEELGLLGLTGGEKISAVVDMTVSSYTTDENGDAVPGEELHILEQPVQIALAAPADARVIRLHEDDDGVLCAEELVSVVSGKEDGTILFESDRFSKYVVLDCSTWSYEYEEGERMLRITGTGAVKVNGVAPWLSQGYDIARVMIDEGITSIGPNVFAGLDGRVRIDFCQETKPEIDPAAFGTTKVVCRHTSKDNSWPTDGSTGNVTWAWMPTFNMMAAGTFSGLSYGEEDGWAVTVQSTDDVCTGMSPETAHEVLLECYDLFLNDLPDTDELEKVIGDMEGGYWMLHAFWNSDAPETLTLNGGGIPCAELPREILVSSENAVLNVTDPRADGIHRVEVQCGVLNYTGNIETLVLTNTGEGNTGTVAVTGTIGEVAYYGADTNAPFFGTLTVTGSVQGGLVYGGEITMNIPGVTESYPMSSAPGQSFGELKDLAAAVVIDTDATPVVAAELEGMEVPTVDQFTLRYMLGGGNDLMLTPLEGSGLGSEPLYVMIDNYNEHFMDNLTDNIVWGPNTEIYLGMPEGSDPVILTGKDGKGVKELGTGGWTTAVVKCPVSLLFIQPDPWDFGSISLTFEGRVNSAYLQPNNCNLDITLRNGGSIGEGRWKQLLRDYRNFDPHSTSESGTLQLVKDSALMVMSWTYTEALGAILPPDTVVGAAAGVDHAMATLTESSVSELSVKEVSALKNVSDGDEKLSVGTSQVISVFDVSVNEYTVDESGEASIGSAVSELTSPIPVTVSNDSDETDVFVVRLHNEADGTVSAAKLNVTDANGGKQFESDLFSTYLLVSANGTTAAGPVITFHSNNGEDETATQEVESGVATKLDPNSFTYKGRHFIGWTTEDQGLEIVYEDEAEVTLTEDLDLYAVWGLNENGFALDVVDITNPGERTWDCGTISGTYTTEGLELEIDECIGASNFGANGCTTVEIHFEPGESYDFVGWYSGETEDSNAQTLRPLELLSKDPDYGFEVAENNEWTGICAVVARRDTFGSSDFNIPATMTVIRANAFEGIGATSIVVPKVCTDIEAEAFKDCQNLRKILLPLNCKIDDHAFDGCSETLIIYAPAGGTTQEWAEKEEHHVIFVEQDRP